MACAEASSLTEAGPRVSRATTARRVGSAERREDQVERGIMLSHLPEALRRPDRQVNQNLVAPLSVIAYAHEKGPRIAPGPSKLGQSRKLSLGSRS